MSSRWGLRAIPKDIINYDVIRYDGEALQSLISVDSLESVGNTLVKSGISLYNQYG